MSIITDENMSKKISGQPKIILIDDLKRYNYLKLYHERQFRGHNNLNDNKTAGGSDSYCKILLFPKDLYNLLTIWGENFLCSLVKSPDNVVEVLVMKFCVLSS